MTVKEILTLASSQEALHLIYSIQESLINDCSKTEIEKKLTAKQRKLWASQVKDIIKYTADRN